MPKFFNKPNEVSIVDGKEIWQSRSIAVVNLVICNKLTLLVKRGAGAPNEAGKWCLPCGYLDYNETLYDAARRETWEESGVDLLEEGFSSATGDQPVYIKSIPNDYRQNVSVYYLWERAPNKPLPATSLSNCEPNEIQSVGWFSYEAIMHNDFKVAFNHKDVIQKFGYLNVR